MAWSVLQSASADSAGGTGLTVSVTYGSNVSSGTKLIAYLGIASGGSLSSVKDGAGNSFASLTTETSSGGFDLVVLTLDTPAGDVGTKPTITVTITGTQNGTTVLVQEVSGLAAGTTTAQVWDGTVGKATGTTGTGSFSATLASYTSTAANEYLTAIYGDDGDSTGTTLTTPGGYTKDANSKQSDANADLSVFYKNSTNGTESPSSISGTGGTSSADYCTVFVAWKLSAAAAANNDIPQVQPGPTWFDLFKPWIRKPRTPVPQAGAPGPLPPPIPFDPVTVDPGPTWLALFKPGLPRPRPLAPPPEFGAVNGTASFALAPFAFSGTGAQTSPDLPQIAPGSTWFDLFKPWIQRPRPVPPARDQVSSSGSFTLAPLAFNGQGAQTSPDIPGIQPGPTWLDIFKRTLPKPRPWIPSAPSVGVGSTGSFALAPLAFSGQAAETSPDVTLVQPGPLWLRLFKPWIQKPVPPVPAIQAINASGSFTLAPLAFTGTAGQTSPDQGQVNPGPLWIRLFKPWLQRPVPPPPAIQSVSAAGSFALAPLAFNAQAGQTSPDIPQVYPGPLWLRLFRPWVNRPVSFLPSAPSAGVTATGSFTLAPLAFSVQGAQTSPDIQLLFPGPIWTRLFRPWVPKPLPPIAGIQPGAGVTLSGSFTLAPLAFIAQGGQTSPDVTQVEPGPAWFRRFKPWAQKPVPPVPAPGTVNATGSFSLAPLAFTGTAGQGSPDQLLIQPGPLWIRLFRPWVNKPLPPVPSRDQVTISGSFALAPLAFAVQAGQTSPDVPQVQPGSRWLRLFKPWVQRPVPLVPEQGPVTGSGSLVLAPVAFSAQGAQTSPDIRQVQPGPTWLKLRLPWRRQFPWITSQPATNVPCSGGITLTPLKFRGTIPFNTFRVKLDLPYTRWVTGQPRKRWKAGE